MIIVLTVYSVCFVLFQAFGHIIKKVKNLGYLAFDSFLTDVKIVFSNLKRLDRLEKAGIEDAEQVI